MRAVIQRVNSASVTVDSEKTGEIGAGLLVLLGIHKDDGEAEITWMVDKIINLRIFEDNDGKMNRSLIDSCGAMLVVSQFTLYGDCRKGRRPGYSSAALPEKAKTQYLKFIETVRQRNIVTASGKFQAHMAVELVNDGPVTLLLDSNKLF
ncbi:D-tyrosyl-tRNA(Tyr) deacylase [Desulfocapsa sulfexigens DSM 10523]|uniref:D-aminoacyl-tRNA deacylase n=1 Tax=Desulfocapsa sulfexigens (strain DSM 10523 / SB164P1) TaxID=1167006 RepID=M1P8Z4_DESSD|nr:D-aminoacyl-tRNA deacylase [Desulfocapsa sulfexigens]AGF78127.1 D-tyrosyl-tRNA(Tyr) deacylase [Desulfocapsa sulfexigens DSM 10523]